MTNTVNKRKVNMPAGMKHKMMAAVSMLVVSSIMVVSSTYAWFTLSTAPEVTGITTNVGANGNLEMALLNNDSYLSTADDLGIESGVGDSMVSQDVTAANETWGNLVDLTSEDYHLNDIVLTPARLNLTRPEGADEDIVNTSILKAPSYGSDGRVIDIDKDTFTGEYDGAWVYSDAKAGVRAIGTSTGVTKRISAYRNAVTNKVSATSAAQNTALKSLSDNGQKLADILMAYVQDPNATFTLDDVKALQAVVGSLNTANTQAGTAIKNAVLAYTLSDANSAELSDDQVTTLVDDVAGATAGTVSAVNGIVMPDGAQAAITQWSSNNTAISSAQTAADALVKAAKSSYTYTEIEGVMNGLIDKAHTRVAGVTGPTKADLQTIINYVLEKNKVDIEMLDGSGIYADIAKLVGDYSLSGMKVTVTYNGMPVSPNATMATKVITSDNPVLMDNIAVGDTPDASSGAGTVVTLSDTYGYALDFGFRTNASVSDLLLQTEAKQRVYDGNDTQGSDNTQGGGSTMTFNSANTRVFSVDDVRALMSAVRVVFVTPTAGGYDILGIAAPDITASTDAGSGVTSYTGGQTVDSTGEDADAASATGIKANLYLYEFTKDDEGVITLGAKKTKTTGVDGNTETTEDGTLTSLTQNVAKKVTAIVYLDGDIVDNTMVANANTSMSGKLNLQFSSSATLVPMENSAMRAGGTAGTVEVAYTQVATAGESFSQNNMTGTVKTGYTIYQGSNNQYYYSSDDGTNKTQMTASNFATAIEVSST